MNEVFHHMYTDMVRASNMVSTGENTYDRLALGVTHALSSAVIYLCYFTAQTTDAVTQITTWTGNSPSTGATLNRIAIYNTSNDNDGLQDLTQLCWTASDTTMWNAADTPYTRPLIDPASGVPVVWTKLRGVRYAVSYLSICPSGNLPNFVGVPLPAFGNNSLTAICNRTPRTASTYTAGPPTDLPGGLTDSALNTGTAPVLIYAELS